MSPESRRKPSRPRNDENAKASPSRSQAPTPVWLRRAVQHCRAFIDKVTNGPHDALLATTRETIARLRRPSSSVEHEILQSLLVNVALQCEANICARFNKSTRIAADVFFRDRSREPVALFAEWAEALARTLGRHDVCRTLADRLRTDHERPFGLPAFAREVAMSEKQLAREFRTCFGMSISEYQRTARLVKALELLTTQPDKVDHIADTVGYKSKKNFYAAFRGLFWHNPSHFRAPSFRDTSLESRRLILTMASPFREQVAVILSRVSRRNEELHSHAAQRTEFANQAMRAAQRMVNSDATWSQAILAELLEKLEEDGKLPPDTKPATKPFPAKTHF